MFGKKKIFTALIPGDNNAQGLNQSNTVEPSVGYACVSCGKFVYHGTVHNCPNTFYYKAYDSYYANYYYMAEKLQKETNAHLKYIAELLRQLLDVQKNQK